MDKKFLLYFFLLTSVLSGCAQVGTPNLEQPSKNERIDELFTRYTDSGEFSGSVLVAEGDQILLRKGYGFANREEQILNTPETLFHIQSMGKIFTYAAVLMEEKEGNLSLDDPIQLYIPGFPNGDKITIEHLLYFRSGLFHYPHDLPGHIYGSLSEPIAMEELIEEFGAFPLKFEPGTQFAYSNAGYTMLASVIESASGIPFDDYLQANIFTQTGMSETRADWDKIMPDLAVGYEKAHGTFIRSPADHVSHFIGAGSVYSTVDDMHRWYQAVYTDGSMREFSLGGFDGRGMGYRAAFKPIPSFDIVIIILSNHMDAPVVELVREVTAILLEDTTLIQLEADDLDAFVGQYEGLSGFGEISLSIDRAAENLIVTQSGSGLFATTRTHELCPLSPNSFVTVEGEDITGSVFTFKLEQDGSVSQVALALNGFELEVIRTD
jgi:CubicO group peptidase (beta-lactamase class C family)